MTSIELLADALAAHRSGDRDQAAELAVRAGRAGSSLADELRTYLAGDASAPVYDQPSAFTAFIRGGGNVGLYRALSAALAARYDAAKPESLLDLGCGDGLAVVPALEQATHVPARIDLVEPSAALLEGVHERVPAAQCWQSTAQEFLARDDLGWDFVQSTFALQSIEPEQRAEVLRALQQRTGTLVLAEFDVPEFTEGSPEHLRSLVAGEQRGGGAGVPAPRSARPGRRAAADELGAPGGDLGRTADDGGLHRRRRRTARRLLVVARRPHHGFLITPG
jgi:phospholipid N-methyltransferase